MREKTLTFSIFLLGLSLGIFLFSLFFGVERVEIVEIEKRDKSSYLDYQERVIEAIEKVSPSVVSIVVEREVSLSQDDMDFFRRFFFYPQEEDLPKRRETGGGSGFFISSEGIIITNRHVVRDENADYSVITDNGERMEAEVLARDEAQDIAFLKVEGDDYPVIDLADSDKIRVGETAIAIGYALAEFENTASKGIVSGLHRRVTATDGVSLEVLENVIQTDAGINFGNSGGPLINIKGEVIGINTAKEIESGNIGFAIPINYVKPIINSVLERGEIVYPFLGVRYVLIDEEIKREKDLPIDRGALIVEGRPGESSVITDSAADRAGLQEGDIIIKLDGKEVDSRNTLFRRILDYSPGDSVTITYLRDGEEREAETEMGERGGEI